MAKAVTTKEKTHKRTRYQVRKGEATKYGESDLGIPIRTNASSFKKSALSKQHRYVTFQLGNNVECLLTSSNLHLQI